MAKAMDTLLGHCMARAAISEHGGADAINAKYGPDGERLSKWAALRTVTKTTPKAMRVATFIVFWAVGMRDAKQDTYSITEYQREWKENERQAYRLQNEFRELFPEFDTPNELARQIVDNWDARITRKEIAKLPLTLRVLA
jgi:hypothetical protein